MATAVMERSFQVDRPAALRVGIPEGIVEVDTTVDDRIDVSVAPLRGDDRALEHVAIDAIERASGLEVSVEAQFERSGFHIGRRGAAFRVRIDCPAGSSLEVSSASADVRATGALGAVRVKTASGDVVVDRVTALTLQSVSGDVSAHEVGGDAVVKTTSGDVDLRSVTGDLVVSAVSGDLEVGALAGELQVSTVSGDVRVGDLGSRATVNGVSSDVELAVAPGRRLWLDVRSASGDVRSDLDVGEAPPASDDPPLVELTVRTVSGDVRIRHAR